MMPHSRPAAPAGYEPPQRDVERVVWQGRSSHWARLHIYVGCLLTCWALVPLWILLDRFFSWHYRRYELTTERLHLRTGVLSRTTRDLELYRVKDITLVQPLSLRVFGLGNVVLTTSDADSPKLTIEAVRFSAWLRDQVRKHSEQCRLAKGVRTVDVADDDADAAAGAISDRKV
jgi:uncharacterized membrane protein YdbT with pleckstrin-like domain